ncbi:MAG TPA: hypothetical protein VIE44_10330 [Methylomirabilota bacterium]|jgi:hypothetical protein
METQENQKAGERGPDRPERYEPPRVEKVVTPADLERETLYAGQPLPSGVPPP